MTKPMRTMDPLLKIINNSIIDLPAPKNISYMWNMGSMMSTCILIQMITGIMLSMHYSPNILMAFESVDHICRDVNFGWLLRNIHSNTASMFFICMYLHTARNIYFGSYSLTHTWNSGVMMMIMLMATAFLGYVLPWGQMSFWGATVITNLLSAIPIIGEMIVKWLWGGFSVNNATLSRFYSLHFMLPFIMLSFIMIHLLLLHQTGSNNPLGLNTNKQKIPFHPYFSFKDIITIILMIMMIFMISLIKPFMLMDPENFILANPMMTPPHIQPEWYFLFAYAILRSIPNKLGGVLALMMSVLILFLLPILMMGKFKSMLIYPINQLMFWIFSSTTILLTWIGSNPVEPPFIITGQILTILYFSYFMMMPIFTKMWETLIK